MDSFTEGLESCWAQFELLVSTEATPSPQDCFVLGSLVFPEGAGREALSSQAHRLRGGQSLTMCFPALPWHATLTLRLGNSLEMHVRTVSYAITVALLA